MQDEAGFSGEPQDEIPYVEGEESVQEESASALIGDQTAYNEEQSWDYDDDEDEAEESDEDSDEPWYSAVENDDLRDYLAEKNFPDIETALASGMNVQSFVGSQGNEVGELRAQIARLEGQIQGQQPAAQAPNQQDQERAAIVNNAAQLRADVARAIEDGDMDMDEGLGKIETINDMVMEDRLQKMEAKFEEKFSAVESQAGQLSQQAELDTAARQVAGELGEFFDTHQEDAMKVVEDYLQKNPGRKADGDLIRYAYGQVAIKEQQRNQRRASARVTGDGDASGAARQAPVDPAKQIRAAIRGRVSKRGGGFCGQRL